MSDIIATVKNMNDISSNKYTVLCDLHAALLECFIL